MPTSDVRRGEDEQHFDIRLFVSYEGEGNGTNLAIISTLENSEGLLLSRRIMFFLCAGSQIRYDEM